MQRGMAGTYTATTVAGETVHAFVPAPPPQPALDFTGKRQRRLERALLACGQLDAVTTLLPGMSRHWCSLVSCANSPRKAASGCLPTRNIWTFSMRKHRRELRTKA